MRDGLLGMNEMRDVVDDDGRPLFCCCEFIDRHGKRSHLMDLSASDGLAESVMTCTPQPLRQVIADLDDRIRMPNYNGAVHLGFDGLLAVIAVPVLWLVATGGSSQAFFVFVALLPLLAFMHDAALVARRRSRFFCAWTTTSFAFVRSSLEDAVHAFHPRRPIRACLATLADGASPRASLTARRATCCSRCGWTSACRLACGCCPRCSTWAPPCVLPRCATRSRSTHGVRRL